MPSVPSAGSRSSEATKLGAGSTVDDLRGRHVRALSAYAIVLLDRDARIVSWNAGAERIFGRRASASLGLELEGLFPPAYSDACRLALEHARTAGEYDDEGWLLRSDGTEFWGRCVIDAVLDRGGSVDGYGVLFADLDELRHHEWRISRRERHYRRLVELAHAGIVEVDGDGVISYCSPATGSILNRATGDLIGSDVADLLHPEDRERARIAARMLARGDREVVVMQLRVRGHGGAETWVEARMRARHDLRSGANRGLVIVVTGADEVRASLRHADGSQRRLRNMLGDVPVGIALVSLAEGSFGAIFECNGAFCRLAGTDSMQAVGRLVSDVLEPGHPDAITETLRRALDTGQRQQVHVDGRAGSGTRMRVEIAPSGGADDDRPYAVICAEDVTEEQRSVAELRAAVDHLRRSNDELEEFARVTAHDFAGPLRGLAALVDLLRTQTTAEGDDEDLLDAIDRTVARMRALMDGVLGYAHARGTPAADDRIDLEAVARNAVESLHEELAEREGTVTIGDLPTISGDEVQLERLFTNLIGNAVKYSGGGPPRIEVSAARHDGELVISVSDRGIGVDEASRERIFELFSRAPEADAQAPGRGIGLATCRQIVARHGGRIWVDDNEPAGSVFRFTIPAAAHLARG